MIYRDIKFNEAAVLTRMRKRQFEFVSFGVLDHVGLAEAVAAEMKLYGPEPDLEIPPRLFELSLSLTDSPEG